MNDTVLTGFSAGFGLILAIGLQNALVLRPRFPCPAPDVTPSVRGLRFRRKSRIPGCPSEPSDRPECLILDRMDFAEWTAVH